MVSNPNSYLVLSLGKNSPPVLAVYKYLVPGTGNCTWYLYPVDMYKSTTALKSFESNLGVKKDETHAGCHVCLLLTFWHIVVHNIVRLLPTLAVRNRGIEFMRSAWFDLCLSCFLSRNQDRWLNHIINIVERSPAIISAGDRRETVYRLFEITIQDRNISPYT